MIKLCVDGKVETRAIGIDPALHIVELLWRALRLFQSHKGFRQHCAMKEKCKGIFIEYRIIDFFTKLAGSLKIHRLDMKPGQGQATQCPGRSVGVFLRQGQGFGSFLLQLSPFP